VPEALRPPEFPGETRLERRLDTWVDRAVTPRGAAIVIATATIAITFASGLVMRLIDHENYPSLGSALWWAVQTTSTVGYGDHVPTTAAGRLLAALVMFFGIGFLAVITAAITSTFVARNADRAEMTGVEASTAKQLSELDQRLEQLDQRLERIEAAVTGSPPGR
jgi:voltage-gated potassium channel